MRHYLSLAMIALVLTGNAYSAQTSVGSSTLGHEIVDFWDHPTTAAE